ncbi:BTB/POZ domain-containing protein 6-like [Paramacrobiotus metropolitanus]|uniref:BTB/POZ domain-containing protein 6-like n=1 Tax=Paramacrobiotus metropolitanus TaxID=2943436 RepID=UPI002445FF91|nr:BTB/POZ domain-containing protein 6-like [Paramacrobiotus metropolitanus]
MEAIPPTTPREGTSSPTAATDEKDDAESDCVAEITDRMSTLEVLDFNKRDIEFSVGRDFGPAKLFRANKELLSRDSAVFRAMFYGGLAENCDKPIDLPSDRPEAFKSILCYMHHYGLIGILHPANVLAILSCADKYDVPRLVDHCFQFIHDEMYAANCVTYLEEAILWHNDKGVSQCLDTVDAFTEAVFRSQPFTAIEQTTLAMILGRNTLSANENVIYSAAQRVKDGRLPLVLETTWNHRALISAKCWERYCRIMRLSTVLRSTRLTNDSPDGIVVTTIPALLSEYRNSCLNCYSGSQEIRGIW